MHIHIFQHVPFESEGTIEGWAKKHGHTLSRTRFSDAGAHIPAHLECDLLISLGGPMSVHDEADYRWLREEKRTIRQMIDRGKYVLGICLGAQLIADVLGAEVNIAPQREIGFFPIELTPEASANPLFADIPSSFEIFHWHGEQFAIPESSTLLASSAGCVNQAYMIGERIMGWQCHPEMQAERIEEILPFAPRHTSPDEPYVHSADMIRTKAHACDASARYFQMMLDRWMG